jgi:hypothetical protein
MEIDIVAIGKSAIYLVESKSSIEKVLVSIFFNPLSIEVKKAIDFAYRSKFYSASRQMLTISGLLLIQYYLVTIIWNVQPIQTPKFWRWRN